MIELHVTEMATMGRKQIPDRGPLASLFNLPRLLEIRWLGHRRLSLFTDKLDVLQDALSSTEVAGLNTYLVINPLLADVVERHRAPRDLIFSPMKGQCSADIDVAHRDLIVLDLDPCRATRNCRNSRATGFGLGGGSASSRLPDQRRISRSSGACRFGKRHPHLFPSSATCELSRDRCPADQLLSRSCPEV